MPPLITPVGSSAVWTLRPYAKVPLPTHDWQSALEKINCLLGAAAVMCGEGYKEHRCSYVLPRREMDAENEMGERKCRVDARGKVVLTSGHQRENP